MNDEKSSWRKVTSGIPQGSVLGPLLFVLYINDLPDNLQNESEIYLYADDTKIFRPIFNESDCLKLQGDIHLMHQWSEKWLLKFHPDKCKTMRIGLSKIERYDYSLKEGFPSMKSSEGKPSFKL